MLNTRSGLSYLISGFELILTPGIRAYVIIPQILNIVLFCLMFAAANHVFHDVENWIMSLLPHWLHWLSTVLWLGFVLMFLLMFSYSFTLLSNLVSAPFNGILAEKVTFHLTRQTFQAKNVTDTVLSYPQMLWRQFTIICYYVPRSFLIFLLFIIPGLQLIATPFWIVFHSWFMTIQYCDYSAEEKKINLAELRQTLKRDKWLSFSFGGCVLLFSLIPIVNLFVMPAAVAGATQLWIERFNR